MIFFKNKDLIGSPHKTSKKGNLFDFIKNRVNMGVCEWEICFKTIITSDVFLTD